MKKVTLLPLAVVLASATLLMMSITTASGEEHLPGEAFQYTPETTVATEKWKKKGISHDDWAEGADLAVSLDQHLYKTILPLIKNYARERKIDVAVKEGTCGISSGLLSRKAVDLAALCCSPAPYDRLPGLKYHTIAMGAIGIVVNEHNPVDSLTVKQVRDIFGGRITRWSLVGEKGHDIPIKPIGRLHCKLRPGHWRLILDNEDIFGENLEEVGTIPDMVRSVASYRGAIGHLRTWNIQVHSDKWKVKAVNVDGISPDDREAILSGTYPFYAVYNIASWRINGRENPLAMDLLKYLSEHLKDMDSRFMVISPEELRKAGWKFAGDELIAPPDKN